MSITNDLPTLGMTNGAQYTGDNFEHWAIRGAFVRANYDYAGRYLFEFSGRYDGTSRFGKNSRFKFFHPFLPVGDCQKKNSWKTHVAGLTT